MGRHGQQVISRHGLLDLGLLSLQNYGKSIIFYKMISAETIPGIGLGGLE
jgi:hypothetical protein